MARAILQRSSVVVLDEATSALDVATEKSLLKAVAVAFENRTVITIAVSEISPKFRCILHRQNVACFDFNRALSVRCDRERGICLAKSDYRLDIKWQMNLGFISIHVITLALAESFMYYHFVITRNIFILTASKMTPFFRRFPRVTNKTKSLKIMRRSKGTEKKAGKGAPCR